MDRGTTLRLPNLEGGGPTMMCPDSPPPTLFPNRARAERDPAIGVWLLLAAAAAFWLGVAWLVL